MNQRRVSRARGIWLISCGAVTLLLPLVQCSGGDDAAGTGGGDAATDGNPAAMDASGSDSSETMDGGSDTSSGSDAMDASMTDVADAHAADAADAADANEAGSTGPVTLNGTIAKGPFINGSTVNVAPIDSAGNPTGATYPTTTSDDIGTFSVVFTYQGPVQLTANGYYYNEIAGSLSGSQLTLNGFAAITQTGAQNAYINLVTHLSHNRIKTLLGGGTALATAVTQAEGELRGQFPVGGTGFDPGATGTQLNLVGGDTLQSEYIFALSSVVAEASQLSTISGGTDAKLQSFLNTFASDFSAGGLLPTATKALLTSAQSCVEPADVKAKLAARYATIGATTVVPDIDKALDSDGDNVVNAIDTCPLIANTTQGTIPNGICNYKAVATSTVTPGSFSGMTSSFAGNIDGVNGPDLFYLAGTNLYVWLNNGAASFATPLTIDLTTLLGAPAGATLNTNGMQVIDMDNDGKADVFMQYSIQFGATKLAYLKGDGTGHFSSLVTVYQQAVIDGGMQMPFQGYTYLALGDFNGDTVPDVAGANYGGSTGIAVHLSQGASTTPTWADPATLPQTPGIAFEALSEANIDGDAYMDLVATADSQNGSPGGIGFIKGTASGLVLTGPPSTIVGTHVFNLAIGDFDGDTKTDFLVAESLGLNQASTLKVIWGDSTFNPTATPTTVSTASTSVCGGAFSGGGSSIPISVGDANGDGKADICLAQGGSIIIADGTRSFLGPVTPDLTPGSGGGASVGSGVAIPPPLVDFNGDGHADLFAQGSPAGGPGALFNIALINLAGNQSW